MTNEKHSAEAPPNNTTAPAPNFGATVLHAAWLAILLGLAMEVLLLLFTAGFGIFPGLKEIAADLLKQVSWSVFVCVGLALGTAASKARAPLMGLLGLLAAPSAFNAARAMNEGTKKALEITGSASASGFSVLALTLLKGLEYGCLGLAVGWVGRRPWGGVIAHVVAGLVVGLLFGGAALGLTYWGAPSPPSTVDLISQGLNEVFFPVGCSLVLFSAEAVGKKAAR
jgi:hypothetical protein